jgi:hypothetical protein
LKVEYTKSTAENTEQLKVPRDKKPKAAQIFAKRAAPKPRQIPHPAACLLASITAASAASFGIHRSARHG